MPTGRPVSPLAGRRLVSRQPTQSPPRPARARRLPALLALACLAALLTAPAAAVAEQRQDAAPETTFLSLSAAPAVVDHGGSTTLSGALSTAGGALAGATVDLASSTDGVVWSESTPLVTDTDGRFSVAVTPDAGYDQTLYRVAFAGSAGLAPAEAQVGVSVRPELSAPLAPLSVGRRSSFKASGTLRPGQPAGAATVALACYRLEAGAWVLRQTVAARVSDRADGSAYSATLSLAFAGTWRLRAVAAAGSVAESWSPWSGEVNVGTGPDAPIWDRDGVSTVPERMARRGNARQLVVVTGGSLGARDGTVRLFDYSRGDWVEAFAVRTRMGSNGLVDGLLRRAGSRTTPTGIWRLPGYVFGTHPGPPAGTRMHYRRITRRSWWSSEHNDTYNKWVETSRTVYGEHLADYPTEYEFAFSSGYNALPNHRVYGRGSGIFVHVFGRGYSAGCVSVSRAGMIRLLRALDPAKHPVCAIGTTRRGTRTCIFAY
jgi:L,D-peptidoglycan transpeptidase YkuD (ErfK/YbiS/YcfS/YnhG family)